MQETEVRRACAVAMLLQPLVKSSSAAQTAHHWPRRGMGALSDLLGGRAGLGVRRRPPEGSIRSTTSFLNNCTQHNHSAETVKHW